MKSSLVLTVSSADRSGIVDEVSRAVADHGGNWEESSMTRLGGRFAGLVCVSVPASRVPDLRSALAQLSDSGIQIGIDAAGDDPLKGHRRLELELTGADHEGIVRDIAHALAERGVNVEELCTARTNAPESGGALFTAQALLLSPPELGLDTLRSLLEALAADLAVEVRLEAAPED